MCLCCVLHAFHVCVYAGKRRYNIKLWKTFTDCFNCLPVAAIIDEKILCMHGGLSPELNSMDQVRRIVRPTDVPDTGQYSQFVLRSVGAAAFLHATVQCSRMPGIKKWLSLTLAIMKCD